MNHLRLDSVPLYSINKAGSGMDKDAKQGNGLSGSFGKVLQEKISEVNSLHKEADKLTQGFMAGQPIELHDVMLSVEKADLALQLTVQIRNKLVEAYKEVSQMQI